MKKQSVLLIPIIFILCTLMMRVNTSTHTYSSTTDNSLEEYIITTDHTDEVKSIQVSYDGDFSEPITNRNMPAIKSTIETMYINVDGVSIDVDNSSLGESFVNIDILIDINAYDFENDQLNYFSKLENDNTAQITLDELDEMFEKESYQQD